MLTLHEGVLRSAMASKLAYANSTSGISNFPIHRHLLPDPYGFRIVHHKDSDAHAYVWESGERSHIVSFRGSPNVLEFCKYMNAQFVPFTFCDRHVRVHHRVLHMFRSIEPMLTAALFPSAIENATQKHTITFCGHSMGGALAAFASAYYTHLTNKKHTIVCHTFGAPKVGDTAFTSWLYDSVSDYVHMAHKWDVVTHFPFQRDYASYNTINAVLPTSYNMFVNHDLDTYIECIRNSIHLTRIC